jgi:hypothetical protein
MVVSRSRAYRNDAVEYATQDKCGLERPRIGDIEKEQFSGHAYGSFYLKTHNPAVVNEVKGEKGV